MRDLEQLYATYYSKVYAYVLAMSQDEHMAEEVTQQAFFQAMKNLKKFRGDSTLLTWVCSIARNCYYDEKRKSQKLTGIDEITDLQDDFDVENYMTNQSALLKIHNALHEMKEPYKEVFSLRCFAELSFAQIGEIFGNTENWARVTYYRSKKMIQNDVKEEME